MFRTALSSATNTGKVRHDPTIERAPARVAASRCVTGGPRPSWEFTALKHQARRARKAHRHPVNSPRTTRKASAQSARSEEPQAISAIDDSNGELAQDLLLGAVAIAKELNWRGPSGQWHVRRVYNLKSKGTLPIHNVPGLGICARRSSLRNFFSALDESVKATSAVDTTK